MAPSWTPYNDTIAAVATPPGIGGIGVIRISGPGALSILQSVFSHKGDILPRYFYYGQIFHPSSQVVLDDGCAVYFKAPASFTGEDVVELHLHGSYYVLKAVLELLLGLGCRIADKGEFTRRAFLNGKMDLTQAESVIDLIHSDNKTSHQVALRHLEGHLYTRISSVRGQLMAILEQVEGSIDFPEEVPAIDHEEVLATFADIQRMLGRMLMLGDFGKMISQGVKCVIVGRPNAGKSSLLNCLAGEERAIVTPIPGTTRDFIDVRVDLGGLTFEFVDTAGVREATDYVETLGINRVQELIRTAAVVLWVLDLSEAVTAEDRRILDMLRDVKRAYLVLNKSDCVQKLDTAWLPDWPALTVSAKNQAGMDALKAQLYEDFVSKFEQADLDIVCNVRQLECLKAVKGLLDRLSETIKGGYEDDLLAGDLKQAVLKLGEITGEEITEEVLDGIFSRFCVGK